MTATPTPIRECDQALDYLYSMLDGDDKARFEAHLATCARCQAELASFGSVRKVAQEALASVEPTPRLTGALHAQLMHEAAQRKPRGKVIPFLRRVVSHPGYAAAAAFLLVGGAVGVQWTRGRLLMPTPAAESAAPTAATTPATPPAPLPALAKDEAKPEAKVATGAETTLDTKTGKLAESEATPVAPTGNAATLRPTTAKELPVTMADPAKRPAPGFKAEPTEKAKEDRALDQKDARVDNKPRDEARRQNDDADQSRAITAQLKKSKGQDSLDDLISGSNDKRAASGGLSAPSTGVFGSGKGGGARNESRDRAPAKPAPRQAQAPEHTAPPPPPAPQRVAPSPAPSVVAKAPAPKAAASNAYGDGAPQAESSDAPRERASKRRVQADEEAPALQAAPATEPQAGRGYVSNGADYKNSAGPPANATTMTPPAEAPAKTESGNIGGKDEVDTDRTRAASLAQNGRCEEATSIYARLDRTTPQRLSDSDRLSYARCLRVLGRTDTAQEELNALRNHVNQPGAVATPRLDAEQKALSHASRKQAADANASSRNLEQAQRPTRSNKKAKRNAAAASDEAAPADNANTKKVFTY